MLKVMIAEDNKALAEQYQNFLAKEEEIEIIGIANDGQTALNIYKQFNPDLVLLDLGLPIIDGTTFIDIVSNYSDDKSSNIIVISGDSNLRLNLIKMEKVYMSISKPIDFDRMVQIVKEFNSELKRKNFPKEKLTDLLLNLNLKINGESSLYLQKTIEIAYFTPNLTDKLIVLYGITAKKFNCSSEKIKSSIRSSVRIINKCSNKDLLCSIFYISKYDKKQQISPQRFLELVVKYLDE